MSAGAVLYGSDTEALSVLVWGVGTIGVGPAQHPDLPRLVRQDRLIPSLRRPVSCVFSWLRQQGNVLLSRTWPAPIGSWRLRILYDVLTTVEGTFQSRTTSVVAIGAGPTQPPALARRA